VHRLHYLRPHLKHNKVQNDKGETVTLNLSCGLDPPDPHVFGPPGSESGSISQRYGSGSRSFYN
jgi:hypothetical protein